MLAGKRILLIIAGGIAAYKSLELIRRLQDHGASVRCVLTKGGSQFVTPLSVSALSGDRVFMDVFSLTDEADMGHIKLSRDADLVVVAPATADIMAKMAAGLADDLATTVLLATDKPVMIAPAMNTQMWAHPATQRNIETLRGDGVSQVGPGAGDLACGEVGAGRMAEPMEILGAIEAFFLGISTGQPLSGRKILVTAGPTHEPIDPVRYIANRSSGKQGYAIASALAAQGAETVLVSGPTQLADPAGLTTIRVECAREMEAACAEQLPVHAAVCVAAVADWRSDGEADQKMKKDGGGPPPLHLVENPDILKGLSQATNNRPELVVGFAAETENIVDHAQQKLARKGCDWIVANDVSSTTGVMGGDDNSVHIVSRETVESWPNMSKEQVAEQIAARIASHFNGGA